MVPHSAASPRSYGFSAAAPDRADLPDGAALIEAIADAGYAGCELGPPGCLGEEHEVGRLLSDCGLQPAAANLPLRLAREDGFAEDLRGLGAALAALADAAVGELPVVLLSDAVCEPDRMRLAGAIERHREAWPGERRQRLLFDNAHRAAEQCRERGFAPALLPQAGSYVETPREVHALLEHLDSRLLGFCFDAGHSAFGGGDPAALLRDAREFVTHARLAEVDRGRLARVHADGGGFEDAVVAGVFGELGSSGGMAADCLRQLLDGGYEGWVVVAADRVLGAGEDFDRLLESAERSRAWLRERGV